MISANLVDMAKALGGEVSGKSILCPGPGHRPHDRSLSVTPKADAPDGFLVHSFAGDNDIACKDYVREKLGIGCGANGRSHEAIKTKAIEYVYRLADGAPYLRVKRTAGKKFYQQRLNGSGWENGAPTGPKIPYRLPELLAAEHDTVVIVEGEKDADNLAKLGFVATTNAGGAGKWSPDLTSYFKGRDVYIIPDNDQVGENHALQVANALAGVTREVRIIRLPGLPPKGDVSDWIAAGGTAEELANIMSAPSHPAEPAPTVDLPVSPPIAPIGLKPWWRDVETIPARRFLDRDRHYCRGTVGASIAAGGRGKTTRACYEAIAFGLGRDPETGAPEAQGPLRVLLLNGEEEQDELDRRVAATCQRYGIRQADLGGRLFVKSVCNAPLRVAKLSKAPGMAEVDFAILNQIETLVTENNIDVIMVDPLISFHGVIESSNEHMDIVIKQGFGAIAKKTNTHCEVFHHPGKPKPGQADTTVEDGRGASAILWAVRSARVFNFMSPQEATKLGISDDERRSYIRIANGKANMGPLGKAKWMRLVIEKLPNGDDVAVASSWSPPNPFDGVSTSDLQLAEKLAATGGYRADSRSPKWFGYAIAEHLHIAVAYGGDNDPKDLARINTIIKTWIKNKVLRIEKRKDGDSKEREFIVLAAGKIATEIVDDEEIV